MAKMNFYNIPDKAKKDIFQQISTNSGLPALAVEKDWWVVQTLSLVFDMDISKHIVFKGGTSLSKGWGLIKRFSEDIDLAIDRVYFGSEFEGSLDTGKIKKLRKKSGQYIDTTFLSEFKQKAMGKGFDNVNIEVEPGLHSNRDRSILFSYPSVIQSKSLGYVKPIVKIEFSCRSLMEPSTNKTFGSLLDQEYPDPDFAEYPITIPIVNPERTFLEKLFLLHEEFHRPEAERRKGDRLSRHLYDIVKLSNTLYENVALSTPGLYKTIVEHRKQFNNIPSVDYNLHRPQSLNPIPPKEVLADWRNDYNIMRQEMIYEQNPPTFEQLMVELNELKNRINKLEWDLS